MRPLILLVAIFLWSLPLAAEVYRWVDAQGVVHYSDTAPRQGAEQLKVRSARSDPERIAAERKRLEESLAAEEKQRKEAIETRQTEQTERELRQRNCLRARERLAGVTGSHRLVRTDADGNRHFLSAAEIDAARVAAQADVTEWCSG